MKIYFIYNFLKQTYKTNTYYNTFFHPPGINKLNPYSISGFSFSHENSVSVCYHKLYMQHYGHNPVSSFWKRKPAAFFHIFMNGCTACINSLTAKIHLHGTIFIHVFMRMINITNVSFYPSFIAMTVCFPIFQIIIICIWIETKLFLEPS